MLTTDVSKADKGTWVTAEQNRNKNADLSPAGHGPLEAKCVTFKEIP